MGRDAGLLHVSGYKIANLTQPSDIQIQYEDTTILSTTLRSHSGGKLGRGARGAIKKTGQLLACTSTAIWVEAVLTLCMNTGST